MLLNLSVDRYGGAICEALHEDDYSGQKEREQRQKITRVEGSNRGESRVDELAEAWTQDGRGRVKEQFIVRAEGRPSVMTYRI